MKRIRYRKMPPLTKRGEKALRETIQIWENKAAREEDGRNCPLCLEFGCCGVDCPVRHRMGASYGCTDMPAWERWDDTDIDSAAEAREAAAVVRWLQATLAAGLKAREK